MFSLPLVTSNNVPNCFLIFQPAFSNVSFAVNGTGNRVNYLYKNGSGIARLSSFAGSAGSNTFASSGLIVSLSAAEYLEIYTYQSSGGSLNALGTSSSPYTFFGGFKLLE